MYLSVAWCTLVGMNSGEHWKLGHRPALDGLRGVAILLVVACHALPARYAVAGREGVTVFFALSGFLITSQLLESHEPALGGFYVRRARRLLPALLVFLAVMVGVGAVVGSWLATPGELVPPLFYIQNFAVMNGLPTGGLTHLWSLAIEEQFYIAWPLVVALLIRRRRTLVAFTASVLAMSVGLRLALLAGGASAGRIYFAPDTNACLLLAGCLLALYMQTGRAPRLSPWAMLVPAATLVALGALPDGRTAAALAPVVAAALAVPAILAAYSGFSTPGWLNLVGRRSYALYLWHYPLVFLAPAHIPVSRWVVVPVMLAVSWLVTLASWRFVEEPFLRKRSGDTRGAAQELVRRHPERARAAVAAVEAHV
jgi:peptidoglycan/LPS O-acetylase OafA/YrhL